MPLGVPLHSCPLYPHGVELGHTPRPPGAPCPDTLSQLPEVMAVVTVAVLTLFLIQRYRGSDDDE